MPRGLVGFENMQVEMATELGFELWGLCLDCEHVEHTVGEEAIQPWPAC